MLAHEFKNNGELDWERLRVICRDVSTLRRGDHSAQRLKLDQDKLEQKRNTTADEMVAQFVRWAKDPAVRELISGQGVSEEERGVEAADGGEVSQRVNESVGQRRSLSARLTGGRRGGVSRTSCRAQRSSNFVPSGTRDRSQNGKSERIRLNQAKEVFFKPDAVATDEKRIRNLRKRSHGLNPKAEIRGPKEGRIPKSENRTCVSIRNHRTSDFGFLSDFGSSALGFPKWVRLVIFQNGCLPVGCLFLPTVGRWLRFVILENFEP